MEEIIFSINVSKKFQDLARMAGFKTMLKVYFYAKDSVLWMVAM